MTDGRLTPTDNDRAQHGVAGVPVPGLLAILGPLGAFLAFGTWFGSWAALLPAVKDVTGSTDGQLGLAMLVANVAALPMLLLGGGVYDRFGSRVVTWSLVALALAVWPLAGAGSPVALLFAFAATGAAGACLDVSMNAAVSALEAAGRRLMYLAHATFSLGLLFGSALTGLARGEGAGPTEVVAAVSGMLLVLAAVSRVSQRHAPPRPVRHAHAPPPSRRPMVTPLLALVGVACGLGFVLEAGLESWSTLRLEEDLGAGPALASMAPASLALAMVAGRMAGQWLAHAVDPWLLLVAGGVLGGGGALTVALAPTPWIAIAGMALAGIGLAATAPVCFGLAGELGGDRRGAAMSTVTTLAYLGSLASPAMMGLVAEGASLQAAFLALALVGVPLAAVAVIGRRM